MRKLILGLLVAGLVASAPVRAEEHVDPPTELGLALGAAGLNLLYVPAKAMVAGVGLVVGALAGVLTGGDARTAYAVWVPTASGTYIVQPEHLSGERPFEFFGTDYADRPSTNVSQGEPTMAAQAAYN